ncbi:MAG TPA: hypothetical protein DEB06_07655, partial [Phycisphaerales bacterium]|nr:hypothetical protein [Phycisphaerales bacterium]
VPGAVPGGIPGALYNIACAQAMLGRTDEAAASFYNAVASGFVDFFHAARDPHLEPIRGHPRYGAVMGGWGKILDARGEADLRAAEGALGRGYTSARDEGLRLSFLHALAGDSFDAARREMERVGAWGDAEVFPAGWREQPSARPDPWVLVLLPTARDFAALVPFDGIGGYFDRGRKRLIAQDIGATLRHEFFHVLHWRHMDRLGQRHPYWIMEGLASVLEDLDEGPDGGIAPAPSWRTNIVKRLERAGRLIPLSRLATMPRAAFVGDRSRANYGQSRAVFMFLLSEGKLREWYARYCAGFDDDPTGLAALEGVFGTPLKEIEGRFRAWARGLPEVGETLRPAPVWLGVEVANGPGDGVVVVGSGAGARVRAEGGESLRKRDVVTSLDGQPVRSVDDLERLLTDRQAGERVELEVRRGTRGLKVTVVLTDRDTAGDGP